MRSEFPVRFFMVRWVYATHMDEERAHQRAGGRLVLPAAYTLDEDGLNGLVACYRLLVAMARRRGISVGSDREGAAEERAVGT